MSKNLKSKCCNKSIRPLLSRNQYGRLLNGSFLTEKTKSGVADGRITSWMYLSDPWAECEKCGQQCQIHDPTPINMPTPPSHTL